MESHAESNSNNIEDVEGVEGSGVKEYIRQRLLEAKSAAELERIKDELEAEGQNPNSIRKVASELRHKGYLKFDSWMELAKIGPKEIIPPEAVLRNIRLQDGDYKMGFVDGMAVMIMASRYNQLLAAGQADLLTNQLRIMEESRKGSLDIAREAAMEAAAETVRLVTEHLDKRRPEPVRSSSMEDTMSRLMEGCVANLMNALFPQNVNSPPGFTREVKKGE